MSRARSLRLVLPEPIRELPFDLAVIVTMVALTAITTLAPVIREAPVRAPIGLAFVLFAPGYAVVAALFPDSHTPGDEEPATDDSKVASGIDGIERVTLSFGLSIAIVALIGLVLNASPLGIRLVPVVISLCTVTLLTTGIAAFRRRKLSTEDRFAVPYRDWVGTVRGGLFEPNTRADAAMNVLVVLSVLLAFGSVTYAIGVPQDGEQFSAVYYLTEDDDGELVADDYPTAMTAGTGHELVLGVDNHEFRTVDYTVVVVEQIADVVDDETVVRDQRELERFHTELDHDETWHHAHEIEPTTAGDDVRIAWLLYLDDVPGEPTLENAYTEAHLWVSVSEPTSSTEA